MNYKLFNNTVKMTDGCGVFLFVLIINKTLIRYPLRAEM
jgi:hypothetical protein